mmetsp:Transcript_13599/g.29954  ORF Transcript_13599/g.29954 Transcript_13599/m.29954 type:complete len:532 (-) Transcript_13599:87-1682(-)
MPRTCPPVDCAPLCENEDWSPEDMGGAERESMCSDSIFTKASRLERRKGEGEDMMDSEASGSQRTGSGEVMGGSALSDLLEWLTAADYSSFPASETTYSSGPTYAPTYAQLPTRAPLRRQPANTPKEPPHQSKGFASSSSTDTGIPAVWCPGVKSSERDSQDEEDYEWRARQMRTGSVGRMVSYFEGDRPWDDVMLRGGGGRHIVVSTVREGGQASKVGVKAGDRLVSVDGRKDLLHLPAEEISRRVVAPTVLVFLGFVGKLQAEVRLTSQEKLCGLSNRSGVLRLGMNTPFKLCEERVFHNNFASIFLAVDSEASKAALRECSRASASTVQSLVMAPVPGMTEALPLSEGPPVADPGSSEMVDEDENLPIFELQRLEALEIVRRVKEEDFQQQNPAQASETAQAPSTPEFLGGEATMQACETEARITAFDKPPKTWPRVHKGLQNDPSGNLPFAPGDICGDTDESAAVSVPLATVLVSKPPSIEDPMPSEPSSMEALLQKQVQAMAPPQPDHVLAREEREDTSLLSELTL